MSPLISCSSRRLFNSSGPVNDESYGTASGVEVKGIADQAPVWEFGAVVMDGASHGTDSSPFRRGRLHCSVGSDHDGLREVV